MRELTSEDSFTAEKVTLLMALRKQGITNNEVLDALEHIPREYFIPSIFWSEAYADTSLPIDAGQTVCQPSVVAWMSASIRPSPRLRVLEIGTGSGYQTAILARLFRRVYTMERHRGLLASAQERLNALGVYNIVTKYADGHKGWPEAAPFERIMVTAATSTPPSVLLEQLSPDDGIMIIPIGSAQNEQTLMRITRSGSNYTEEQLMPVYFPPLLEGKEDS